MENEAIHISVIRETELDDAFEILEKQEWTKTRTYLHDIYLQNPSGFFGAYNASKQLLGFAIGGRIAEDIGEIQLIVVHQEYQRRGIGSKLLKAVLEHLGNCNVYLDALVGTDEFYRKSGFEIISFKTARFRKLPNTPQRLDVLVGNPGIKVLPLADVAWDKVVEYDNISHPYPRGDILMKYFEPDNKMTFVAVNAEGEVTGLICYSPDNNWLSPFYADSSRVAELLLNKIQTLFPGCALQADVPVQNTAAARLTAGWQPVIDKATGCKSCTTRMYTKHVIKLSLHKVYSLKYAMGLF